MVQISRGFGFSTMWSVDEPDRYIKYLDRYVLESRIIMVEKIRDDTRGLVYCVLIKLLQEKDLCFAASRSMYFHIEDSNFSEQDFLDLLPICWESYFKLVEEV
ncbi:hypothetical protein OROMI_014517 [Orobanche minor]